MHEAADVPWLIEKLQRVVVSFGNLGRMPPLMMFIRSRCLQGNVPEPVMDGLEEAHDMYCP